METRTQYNARMRVYMLNRYHKRRAAAIAQLGGKCKKCGSTSNLQIDHEDRTKKVFNLARCGSYSEVRWQEELTKCQLLCAPCHLEKSRVEISKYQSERQARLRAERLSGR